LFAEGATNGLGTSKYPFSSNAFPTLNQDGTAIGRYIKSVSPSATVAVLYENDNLGQPFLQGLESVLDGSKVKIVSTQSFDVSSVDVTNQMTTLAASKATYFVAGLTGAACTQSVSYLATSSWQPIPMVPDSCPAANFTSIPSSVSSKIIGANVLKGVVGPTYLSGSGVALYRKWMNKTGGQIEQPSEYGWYGASLDVSAIEKAKTLSRVDVAKAAASFPSLTPGIMLPGISIQGWQQGSPVIKKIAMLRFNPAAKDFGAPIAIENAIPVS
jgi:branched-chain amino acid transport system substrate-binding protein